jgi:tetratricopeptide (TPR) repeat protein
MRITSKILTLSLSLSHPRKFATSIPRSPIPHNNIGLALTRMGDVDGAIAAFHLGLASTEDGAYGRGMIHSNLGHLYQSMSRPDLAIASLEMAIAEGPTIETFCNLGTALIDVGDHARAEQVMRQGLQMVEGERVSEAVIVAMRVLSRALVMQERIDQALGVLSEVGSGLASDDFLFAASALARFDLGGALRCLASALRLNPHSPKGDEISTRDARCFLECYSASFLLRAVNDFDIASLLVCVCVLARALYVCSPEGGGRYIVRIGEVLRGRGVIQENHRTSAPSIRPGQGGGLQRFGSGRCSRISNRYRPRLSAAGRQCTFWVGPLCVSFDLLQIPPACLPAPLSLSPVPRFRIHPSHSPTQVSTLHILPSPSHHFISPLSSRLRCRIQGSTRPSCTIAKLTSRTQISPLPSLASCTS